MTDVDSGSGERQAAGGDRGEIVFYQAAEGKPALEVRLERNALWLTQQQMTDLFDTERSVITKHLRDIFRSGELTEESNVQKMHIAGSDKPVAFYHLDAIIAADEYELYVLRRAGDLAPFEKERIALILGEGQ